MRRNRLFLLLLTMCGLVLRGFAVADAPQLSLSPADPQVLQGKSASLHALLQPSPSARATDLTGQVSTWTSSAPGIARVDQNGTVMALSRGTTTITATLGALTGTTTVRVLAPAITISPTSIQNSQLILVGLAAKIGFSSQLGLLTLISVGDVPLVITSISIAGTNASDFAISYNTPPVFPVSLAPGDGLQFSVNFAPGAGGTRTAQVVIPDNAGTQMVPLSGVGTTCLGPILAAESAGVCPDSDGDGFNDAWEMAGGIDFNNDGVVTADEMIFTSVDPIFPDGTPNLHASADASVKDVLVKYDWMELSDQLSNGQPVACTVNPPPLSGPPDNFQNSFPYHSDQCAFDQLCVSGVCRGHSDQPDGAALKMVIDAFAAHNVRLHLIKGHALPHSNVISYGRPIAACIADTASFTFSGTAAVAFEDLQSANFNASYNGETFSEGQLAPLAHYAIFGHRHTCDSRHDCAQLDCETQLAERVVFNSSGQTSNTGSQLIVSLGLFADVNQVPGLLVQGGTFMHELGHNLGLDHGGPISINGVANPQRSLNFKPNYISVMNYNHQGRGISTASANCAPGDYLCRTTPVSVRLDYSSFANGVVPASLDENQGSDAAGISLGSNDMGYNTSCGGPAKLIPGIGPVDWKCDGDLSFAWCPSGCAAPFRELNNNDGNTPNGSPSSGDVLLPFEDWSNLIFTFPQISNAFPGASGAGMAPSLPEIGAEQRLQKSTTPSSRRASAKRHKKGQIAPRPRRIYLFGHARMVGDGVCLADRLSQKAVVRGSPRCYE